MRKAQDCGHLLKVTTQDSYERVECVPHVPHQATKIRLKWQSEKCLVWCVTHLPLIYFQTFRYFWDGGKRELILVTNIIQ